VQQSRSSLPLIAAGAVGFAAGCFLTAALRNPNQALALAFPLGFGALWVLWMVYFTKKKVS